MNSLEKAAEILKQGGIVIYPTETVYGIGCLLNFPESIQRLYSIKKREEGKPTSVLVPNVEKAKSLVKFNESALKLANTFWPGPLTMCLPIQNNVPKAILGADNTLGLRIPGSKWLRELLELVNEPLLAPSANFAGGSAPKSYNLIDNKLFELVDYVVDIDPEGQKPSTVIIFSSNGGYEVVREGDITKEIIKDTLEK